MNKVFNVNLGGYPFTIDEDAYNELNQYLKTIHHHFRNSEGYEEITSDIEMRLAELFEENLNGRAIVTIKDIKVAIAIMGTPEDFGAEPVWEENSEERAEEADEESDYRTGKRLFRNPDDEVVGGVCSGISAYFGINDPLWIRLAFILVALSGGIGLPLYLILWAIVPKAASSADRLAMRGENINVSNIAQMIEEEINHLSSRLSDFDGGLGSVTGKKKRVVEPVEQEQY
ncbi:MAG: PspC domain-containing protein [Saprospiraceae bacterium]